MKKPTSGGGWPAIWYTVRKARAAGGVLRMYRALRSKNACKTCALGMGGLKGGMVSESGRFPEVCKKSVQAMAADMQGRVREGFFEEFSFEKLGRMTPRELEGAGRLVEPLIARQGDRSYRRATWEEAMGVAADAMREAAGTPDETFFYFSGRSSNEAAYLLQLVARLYGTNNVNNCSYFCHQASGVGLRSVTGSGTATITLEDVDKADLVFLIGANPASNHPRLMRSLVDLKRRSGKVVVINPLREMGLVNFRVPSDVRSLMFGSKIADVYVQPHIGGDIALLMGVAKGVLASGAEDRGFIESHTEGWEAFAAVVDGAQWERIEAESGVSRGEVERVAGMYAASRAAIFAWTMGMTHHAHGVGNVRMIGNVALMRGMLGRPGAGLLPLRGHSNVQGVGSMGAVPMLPEQVLGLMQERLGVRLPTGPGLDTLGCVTRAAERRVKFAMHLGGNLYGSCPDSERARAALAKIGTTVFLSTTLNTGHVHGRGGTSIILPVLARDEEEQATTQESMFNYVRMSEGRGGSKARHVGPRSEVRVISELAHAVMGASGPIDFAALAEHRQIRKAIAETIPGYAQIGRLDESKREFHIDGRVFHEPRFATGSGRARFHAVAIPTHLPHTIPGSAEKSLRLMTIRSEGQFNTVVYEEEDLYRGMERRDVVMMNAADIRRLGLKVDERVTVRSATGLMAGLLVREAEIRAGNAAMYYPEANVLAPATADAESRTPAFKHIPVTVEREAGVALPVVR